MLFIGLEPIPNYGTDFKSVVSTVSTKKALDSEIYKLYILVQAKLDFIYKVTIEIPRCDENSSATLVCSLGFTKHKSFINFTHSNKYLLK